MTHHPLDRRDDPVLEAVASGCGDWEAFETWCPRPPRPPRPPRRPALCPTWRRPGGRIGECPGDWSPNRPSATTAPSEDELLLSGTDGGILPSGLDGSRSLSIVRTSYVGVKSKYL